jgi:hypothetical protein
MTKCQDGTRLERSDSQFGWLKATMTSGRTGKESVQVAEWSKNRRTKGENNRKTGKQNAKMLQKRSNPLGWLKEIMPE